MNPAKLKVVELRSELSARGLDTKGNKAVLVERLQEALDKEGGGGDDADEKQEDGPEEQTHNQTSTEQEQEESEESSKAPARAQSSERSPSPEPTPEKQKEPEPAPVEDERQPSPQKAPTPQRETTPQRGQKEPTPQRGQKEPTPQRGQKEQTPQRGHKEQTPQRGQKEPTPQRSPRVERTRQRTPVLETEQMEVEEGTKGESDKGEVDVKESKHDIKEEKPDVSEHSKHLKQTENGDKEGFEQDVKPDIKSEEDIKTEEGTVKTEHSENRDRKRKRSSSPRRKPAEWEPDLKDNEVTLSWYDSDLNLTIDDKRFLSATPMSDGGFGYVWAGVRGSHGYTSGSLCYQVKVTSYLDVSHLEDEPNPNVLRVGWSVFTASLQLGEEPLSYGYGGTGKFAVNCKFSNFGKSFGLNDVITCYLEFTGDEVVISYGLNDEYLGVAARVAKSDLDGRALFPHVLTKNAGFAVNFGEEETPWAEIKEGFTFLSKHPVEEATPGPRRPEKRSDCEMIMMCGLPACGKTTWASKYASENHEKNYNILGTNALIDKMKVMGLPRKANYSGRWDILIEKCTKCLQRLMDIGCRRRRNYILDQTNVFPAAQRRKMRNFEGFTRKAVVIVPTDEEFKSRVDKQANEEKKDVPESAVLEMKANFTLPDKDLFDEVMYVELPEEEASALVQKYAKEANEKGFVRKSGGPPGGGPPNKRFRGGDFHHKGDFRRDRFGPSGTPGSPFRRGSDRSGPRGGGGGWGGPRGGNGPSDRWRDNRSQGGYGRPSQGDRSGWRGPSSGGPPGNNRGPRDFDRGPPRSGGFDRNARSGPGGPGGRTGSGFNNRDSRDRRGPGGGPNSGMGGKPRQDQPRNTAGQGGNQAAPAQWNNQYGQNQGQVAATNNQTWGQPAQWGQQAQAWNNYQQQWKGYQQGYNQQGYGQGYNTQQYNNWQQYYGNYNQQGGWGQQNSDGTYSYPQSWQNWYAAQNAGQSNTTQPPPSAK